MSGALLDVTALLALLWENHDFHEPMAGWFVTNENRGWATCPITEQGFVRIVSNASYMKPAPKVRAALDLLQKTTEASVGYEFWADDLPLAALSQSLRKRLQGHNQITDAYLLTLAMHRKARLVTFDYRMASLAPKGSAEHPALEILQA